MLWLLIYTNKHKPKNDFCQIRQRNQRLKKIITEHFFRLCSLVYINDHNTYDIEDFSVYCNNIYYCSCKLFWAKIYGFIIAHCDKYDVYCLQNFVYGYLLFGYILGVVFDIIIACQFAIIFIMQIIPKEQ